MIDFRVEVTGIRAIGRRFDRATTIVDKNTKAELQNVGFLVQREARRNAKFLRGDLERSITFIVGDDYVDCLVPLNSPAGPYAMRQHDVLKGRGKKTRAKGARAGWKYIERAIIDEQEQIEFMLGRAAFEDI